MRRKFTLKLNDKAEEASLNLNIKKNNLHGIGMALTIKPGLFDQLDNGQLSDLLKLSYGFNFKKAFLKEISQITYCFDLITSSTPSERNDSVLKHVKRNALKGLSEDPAYTVAHSIANAHRIYEGSIENPTKIYTNDEALFRMVSLPNSEEILKLKTKAGQSVADLLFSRQQNDSIYDLFISLSNPKEILVYGNRTAISGFVTYAPSNALLKFLSFSDLKYLLTTKDEYGRSPIGGIIAPKVDNRGEKITDFIKAKALLATEVISREEEELTRLIFSHLGDLRNYNTDSRYYEGTIGDKILELVFSGVRKYPNLPFLYEALVEFTNLNESAVLKLEKAIDRADTNVKKALAAKGLVYIYEYNYHHFGNDKINLSKFSEDMVKNSKDLLYALEVLPTIMEMKTAWLELKDKMRILCSQNVDEAFGSAISYKLADEMHIKVQSEEGRKALDNYDFVTDLFSYFSKYDYSTQKILTQIANEYFQGGTKRLKEFKFNGHKLAAEQLGPALNLKNALMQLDKEFVQYTQKAKISFYTFETALLNYNQHIKQIELLQNLIKNNSKNLNLELEKLSSSASSPALKNLILTKNLIELKSMKFSQDDEKLKRSAIWNINLLNFKSSLEYIDQLIKNIRKIQNLSISDQETAIITLSHEARSREALEVVESIKILRQYSEKNNILTYSLQSALSILSILKDYNKSVQDSTIISHFSFDLSQNLTFGRYGSSGSGNCQKSTGDPALNQSLMSMILDANQFMIVFNRLAEEKPLGFMQVHLLQSKEKGTIFVIERPYTNEPNMIMGMKESLKLLAIKVKNLTGVDCYIAQNNGDKITISIPPSYVNRFIDAVSVGIGKAREEAFVYVSKLDNFDYKIRK